MKKVQQAAKAALVLLKEAGADKAQCVATERVVQEFNVDGGKFSLYRTLFDESLSLQAIKEGRNGSISVNSLSEESIAGAVKGCMEGAEASTPDDAWDFCRDAARREFCDGVIKPDLDLFFERLKELMEDIAKRYPLILMEQMIASHTAAKSLYELLRRGICPSKRSLPAFLIFGSRRGEILLLFRNGARVLRPFPPPH